MDCNREGGVGVVVTRWIVNEVAKVVVWNVLVEDGERVLCNTDQ